MMHENQETDRQRTARLLKQEAEAQLAQRIELGRRRKLWRVTVYYELYTGLPERLRDGISNEGYTAHYIDNRTWGETVEIRERLFKAGLAVDYDPGTLLVIPPNELKAIFVTNQERYFEP